MAKVEIVEPRKIVKASNDFVRSRCKIKDVVAGRILMAFASLVDETDINENGSFLEYKISASSVMGDINAGGDYYNQVRNAAYTLLDQKLERKIGKRGFQLYTLFSTIRYDYGIITGEFHKDLKPFFLGLAEKFTKFNLQQYMTLPSIYSQKMYAFLKSWNDKPYVVKSVSDLQEMLHTPDSFRANFKEFRRWVLEKAHKDIHKHTSLRYEWEPIKKGRAVAEIRFIFSKKRALPITQKKEDDAIEKERSKNNANFKAATACLKERGPACEGGHQKEAVCEVCRKIR